MDRELQEWIRRRAHACCEYCQMPEQYDGFSHEIDHFIAKKHRGLTVAANLVLACFPCNNHKGPNIAGIDPVSKKLTPLFNPRRHKWTRHFEWNGPELVGKTAIGRVTLLVLEINATDRVLLRQSLMEEGLFPPVDAGEEAG